MCVIEEANKNRNNTKLESLHFKGSAQNNYRIEKENNSVGVLAFISLKNFATMINNSSNK